MNATKLKVNKSVDEQLHEIKHILKVLSKGQEQIKSHLWSQEHEETDQDEKQEHEKKEAINYINNIVIPEIEAHKAEQGEIGVQGLGDFVVAQLAQPVAEWLKARALEYVGEALAELKRKAIPYAVEIADWIIDKIENIIVNKYQEASEEQQEQFKEEIEKTFPNSRLLGKL